MSKRLSIRLNDYPCDSFDDVRLSFAECSNIISKIEKDFDGSLCNISKDDFANALDLLIVYFYKYELTSVIIDVEDRNKYLGPAKEMTLEEIEAKLGHKVKIVNKEE